MAFASYTRWNVQADGNDTNGGSFGGSGTDRSLQANAQVVIDNVAITATVTGSVITFTGGYTPTAADLGNCVNLISSTGGTAPTLGRYQITAQNSTTWTVDRTTGANGATITSAKMGGALATPNAACTYFSSGNQQVFIKYSPTPYNITAALTPVNNNADYYGNVFAGYYATQGDAPQGNNRPTIRVNAAVNGFTMPAAWWALAHLILDGNGTTRGLIGIKFSGGHGNSFAYNCKITGFAQEGVIGNRCIGCEITGCGVTGGTAATNSAWLLWCWVHHNSKHGGYNSIFANSISSFNTGSGAYYATGAGAWCMNSLFYGNTGSGVDSQNNYMPSTSHFINNVFAKNGGYGLGSWNFTAPWYICSGNVFWSNTSGVGTWTGGFMTGPNTIIPGTDPTNDPFVDKANGDFRFNNVAGAGALARGVCWPSWPNVGLGYVVNNDPGPFQHQDVGGTFLLGNPGMDGGF